MPMMTTATIHMVGGLDEESVEVLRARRWWMGAIVGSVWNLRGWGRVMRWFLCNYIEIGFPAARRLSTHCRVERVEL